jgi:hypothetical protein
MESPAHSRLQEALQRCNALADAAESHGTLAGALCAAHPYTLADWLGEILPEGNAPAAIRETLRQVFNSTRDALAGRQMTFDMLLPDDEQALAERTTALGEWCQGFLYGLGTGHLQDPASAGGEVGEIIADFTAITQVDVDPDDSVEASESAYAELVEFVRVGVQLLFEQLQPLREPPVAPPGTPFH